MSGTNTAESGADPGPRGSFLSRLWRICRGYYTEPATRTRAIWLTALVLALTFIQIGIQVLFNLWNRAFFDALEARDRAEFWRQGLLFLGLLAASVAATVAHTWSRQVLALDWRKWLVHRLQSRWLEGGRHYQMNFLPGMADNPDQRISENTRWATTLAVELGVGLLTSFVMLVSFIGILWTLSGPLHVAFGANEFEIPGYMVWGALIYATLGAGFTVLVGAPMVGINIRRNEAEGDHRFALIRMRENSESIALIRGEADEDRGLRASFSRVLRVMGDLYGAERRLLWLTSAYGMAQTVVPIVIASPRYFAGAITLGVLMQISQAFLEVTRSLNWLVDNFPKLADWRSHVERVVELEDSFDAAQVMEGEDGIRIEEGPLPDGDEVLAFRHLQIGQVEGNVIIDQADAEIRAGEKVLIVGESGTGKSTLFRAIAGLWPWGSGEIRTPPRDAMMFMPQRPYLPLGSLRAAIAYPAPARRFPDAAIRAALERAGLPHLPARLEEEERWDRILSLGEQQRLAFARLLLHRPRWVFMDEATAALDEENQDAMMRIFSEDLAGSALVSIGHRPGLDAYHDRTLHLVRSPDGARLAARRRVAGAATQPVRRRTGGALVAAGRGALRRMLRRPG